MKLFAPNTVVAKSRFWYFLKKFRKVKKTTGEIISVTEIKEEKRLRIKNYGVWLRYDTRSNKVNMYKEYREPSRCAAIHACYQDMAGRHRARFPSIQILKIQEVAAKDCRRAYTRQFLTKVKFPLMHRVPKQEKQYNSLFVAHRPRTF